MATVVPRYSSKESISSMPAVRFSPSAVPDSFGAAQGRALSTLGGSLVKGSVAIADAQEDERKRLEAEQKKLRARQDKIKAREAFNNYQVNMSNVLQGDIFQTKGSEAGDAPKRFFESSQKVAKQMSTELSPEASELFWSNVSHFEAGRSSSVFKHAYDKTEEAEIQSMDAMNKNAADFAISSGRPEDFEEAKETITQNIKAMNRGQSPEVIKKKTAEAMHDLYSGWVESLEASDPRVALDQLRINREHVDPVYYQTKVGELKDKAAIFLDEEEARKVYYKAIADKKPRGKVLEQIRDKYDASRASRITGFVERMWAEDERARKHESNRIENDETLKALANPQYVPRSDLSAEALVRIRGLQAAENMRRAGQQFRTDGTFYNFLKSLPSETLATTSLLPYAKYLSPEKMKEMAELKAKALQGQDSTKFFRNINEQVQSRIKGLSMFDVAEDIQIDKRSQNSLNLSRFHEQLHLKLDQIPKEEQTPTKIDEVISELLRPVSKSGWGIWEKVTYSYEAPYTEQKVLDPSTGTARKMPKRLQGRPDLQWDSDAVEGGAWVDNVSDTMRVLYDPETGEKLKEQELVDEEKAEKVKPEATISPVQEPSSKPLSNHIIDAARETIGIMEEKGNTGRAIARFQRYGKSGDRWCAGYVCEVIRTAAEKAGVSESLPKTMRAFGLIDWAKRNDVEIYTQTRKARPGDVVVLNISHTGIIESVDSQGNLVTIEGNTSKDGRSNEGVGVFRRVRKPREIRAMLRTSELG